MLRKSKSIRIHNFFNSISDWQKYYINKLFSKDSIVYTTRKRKIKFKVPANLGGIFKEIFFDEFYDLNRIKSLVDHSSVVFDVGANAGYFTIFIEEKLNPKAIHCFEPFPNNYRLLDSNVRTHGKADTKVILNNMAMVSPGIDSISLFFNENSSFSPTASILKDIEFVNNEVKVKAIDLEKYCAENSIQKIDLLKMDCEGAEYDIFYNLKPDFLVTITGIYMETHDLDLNLKNTTALVRFFNQSGYKTSVMPINDKTAMVWAQRN